MGQRIPPILGVDPHVYVQQADGRWRCECGDVSLFGFVGVGPCQVAVMRRRLAESIDPDSFDSATIQRAVEQFGLAVADFVSIGLNVSDVARAIEMFSQQFSLLEGTTDDRRTRENKGATRAVSK